MQDYLLLRYRVLRWRRIRLKTVVRPASIVYIRTQSWYDLTILIFNLIYLLIGTMITDSPNITRDIHATRSSRVAGKIRDAIESGEYAPGMLLPARRLLARNYAVSLTTIEAAIKSLIADGLLRAENGRGTFVRQNMPADGASTPPTDVVEPARYREPRVLSYRNPPVLGIVSFLDPDYETAHPRHRRDVTVIIEAFERTVSGMDGTTHFTNTFGHPQTPEYIRDTIIEMVEEFAIQGVLIAAPRFQVDIYQSALMSPIPAVVANGELSPAAVHQVYYDSREAGYRAASLLINNQHEKLLYFAPYVATWVADRRAGIDDALVRSNASIVSYVDFETDAEQHIHDQRDIATEFAKSVPMESIAGTGVVACNDAAAVGLMQHAASQGLIAGIDYSIVGFDDLDLARQHGLATFRPPLSTMGVCAADLLTKLSDHQDCPMRAGFNSEFVMRKSLRQSVMRPVSSILVEGDQIPCHAN